MEYNLVGKMLMEGLDVYLPLVDDHGADRVIKKEDGTFIEIQIKARSNEVTFGDAGLFEAITHDRRILVVAESSIAHQGRKKETQPQLNLFVERKTRLELVR